MAVAVGARDVAVSFPVEDNTFQKVLLAYSKPKPNQVGGKEA